MSNEIMTPEEKESAEDLTDFSWSDVPGLLFLWTMMLVVFVQFFARYVLNDSPGWTEEVARYLLIMVTFFGGVTAVRKGTQISLEFIFRFVSPGVGRGLAMAADLIGAAFYGYLAASGLQLAGIIQFDLVSIPVPKSAVYSIVAVALAAMSIYSLINFVRKMKEAK